MRKKVFFLEVNELNLALAREAASAWNLKYLDTFLNLEQQDLFCEETKEHEGLDPWVQWVSIHTGLPYRIHKVKELGYTQNQPKQIWETLAEQGVRCGVVGAMNAPKGWNRNIKFFIPDPWSFLESCHPKSLNKLFAIPRYFSKNYLSWSYSHLARIIIRVLLSPGSIFLTLKYLPSFSYHLIRAAITAGINVHSLAVVYDILQTELFLQLRRERKTDFNILFINLIAHIQHQFWIEPLSSNKNLKFAFESFDYILKILFSSLGESEVFIAANALNQEKISESNSPIFRPIDPKLINKLLNIKCQIEQNMTNDGTLIFLDEKSAQDGKQKLESVITSSGQNLFNVSQIAPYKVFYYIDHAFKAPIDNIIFLGGKEFRFSTLFKLVCYRTGKHINTSFLKYKNLSIPETLLKRNHQIHKMILKLYGY